MRRPIRELSSRVNINVHRLPNRLNRSAWWLALSTGVGSLLWLIMQFAQGENRIYQSGDVTTAHRMFENECWRCHTEWTPLHRLLAFDVGGKRHATSTSNEKCETCHLVSDHQPKENLEAHQVAHKVMKCAECHQEHQGRERLARPKNEFCVRCHEDLKYLHGQGAFENKITGFDVRGGHPEFLVNRLIEPPVPLDFAWVVAGHSNFLLARTIPANIPAANTKRIERLKGLAVEKFRRSGEEHLPPRWQDRGRIRFNHARHLHSRRDDNGQLVEGLLDENRELVDLSKKCETCHQPDPDHRFFKPIQFETHCCRCHPLLFDPLNYPQQSVPHEVPEIIRGFLTETYTLRAFRGADSPIQASPQQFCPTFPQQTKDQLNGAADHDVDQIRRPLPGHRDQQKLTQELAAGVLDKVHEAEAGLLGLRHVEAGNKAILECRYCHEVEPNPATPMNDWRIVPTQIPSRWLPHGEFHHEPHRLMSCGVCHVDVAVSENTGDVLIPSRDICLACHAAKPKDWSDDWQKWLRVKEEEIDRQNNKMAPKREMWRARSNETRAGTAPPQLAPLEQAEQLFHELLAACLAGSLARQEAEREEQLFRELLKYADRGTRTECVECHTYHNPALDKWNGPFGHRETNLPKP